MAVDESKYPPAYINPFMDKLFEWMHEPILPHINVENILYYIK